MKLMYFYKISYKKYYLNNMFIVIRSHSYIFDISYIRVIRVFLLIIDGLLNVVTSRSCITFNRLFIFFLKLLLFFKCTPKNVFKQHHFTSIKPQNRSEQVIDLDHDQKLKLCIYIFI